RNLVCSGAEPAAVTDCLNFGNPEKPDRYWQFKNCLEGIVDACNFFHLPVISGNVSFYNENPRGAIYPTPAIGMVGIVDDAARVCTQNFKKAGDCVVLLGQCKEELGGSEYLKELHGQVRGEPPALDLALEQAVQQVALEAIRTGLVSSAHDCSEGGLASALAECCISDGEHLMGAVVDGLDGGIRTDSLFFGESQSRIILSCPEASLDKIKQIAGRFSAPFKVIGKTGGRDLKISHKGRLLVNLSCERMHEQWANSLSSLITA
ncbi:MAG: AIR synthase-related protein, partial [Candidatus Omnitrophota bacterium]